MPVTVLRPFNTYGPRQSSRAVMPQIITQILNKNTNLRLGSLDPTRDFNFVKDTCEAFIAVAESDLTIGRLLTQRAILRYQLAKLHNLSLNWWIVL